MKKILFALMAALLMCSCGQQFGLAYGVGITGDGDGNFAVTFPQGAFAMDGTATIDFFVGDSIPFGTQLTTKAEVIEKGDPKQLAALQKANECVAKQFGATATQGDGTYDLWIHGFIKELGTGLVFEIDRHLTNRTNNIARALSDDPYPFVK